MPISINNSLPSFNLHLSTVDDAKNYIRILLNTGGAMNICNFSYHLWIMSQYPEMVRNFFQYDVNIEYASLRVL